MLNLQILDIGDDDVNFKYTITLYCKDVNKNNVVCHIKGFKPSFYIRVPNDNSELGNLKRIIRNAFNYNLEQELLKKFNNDCDDPEFVYSLDNKMKFYTDSSSSFYCGMTYSTEPLKHKSFYNFSFNENESFTFYKLEFTTNFSMVKYIKYIKKYYYHCLDNIEQDSIKSDEYLLKWLNLNEKNCDCEANLYESKVSPVLKFIHEVDLKPCGWINIDDNACEEVSNKEFNCYKEYNNIHYSNIKPINDNDNISQFKILSFDIECDSLNGDFPNPKKDFKKLADEIYTFIWNKNIQDIEKISEVICKCVKYAFDGIYNNYITKDNNDITKIDVENHYDNLDDLSENILTSNILSDYEEIKDKKHRNKYIKEIHNLLENNLKYTIVDSDGDSFRAKVVVKGDPIIQIGNVYYDYNTNNYYREIIVFKDNVEDDQICNDIPGINLIRCKSEKELLLEWMESIKKHNPDYITGYNIFGFDFNFISERVDTLFKCSSGCKTTIYDNGTKKMRFTNHCSSCEKEQFYKIGRILENNNNKYRNKLCKSVNKELSSSGLGDNELKFIHMDGRILFDMQKEIQKGHALESYKLDNVSSHFMKGKLKRIRYMKDINYNITVFSTNNLGYLKKNDYIGINVHTKWGVEKYKNKKFMIDYINKDKKQIYIKCDHDIVNKKDEYFEWCLAKDDISPKDIFACHKNNDSYKLDNGTIVNGPEGRAEIAKYCVMDCELVINLVILLDIIPNNIGMANVCSVPQSFIFLRGQGIKVNSLMTKFCNNNNIRIPTLQAYDPNNKEGFEGAIVLDPEKRNTTGMYLEDPVAVVDYASLYPSSIIENNFSHETFICTEKDYLENPEKYNNFKDQMEEHPDWYTKATYSDYEFTEKFKKNDHIRILDTGETGIIDKVEKSKEEDDDTKYYIVKGIKYTREEITNIEDKHWDKRKLDTHTTCYFKSQFYEYDEEDGPKYGIVPRILKELLDARSATKKRIKTAESDDKKKVLEGLQLSYKLTANSVYGQLGAKTSAVFFKKIAACTTAIGRQRIYDAENGTIEWAKKQTDFICTDTNKVNIDDRAKIVYGDTDSVFIKFSRYNKDGILLTGEDAIKHCIECGKQAGEYVTNHLLNVNFKGKKIKGTPIEDTKFKGPQDLEYEKTFENFILISKKRYIGDKHEMVYLKDPKRTSMGIVMKRRDNAPIVKYVYGNILEILMKQKDVIKAKNWLINTLKDINLGKMSKDNLDMFVITKSLRGYYKNPEAIAHKVLADRIADRDPGNKPKPNDRIPYAYIQVDDKSDIIGYRKKKIDELTGEYYKKTIKVPNGTYQNGKPKSKTITVDDTDRPKTKKVSVDDLDRPIYKKKHILQGDRIEHRDYIIEKDIPLDFKFYITNQIMKPVSQLLEIQLGEKEIDEIFNPYINC